MQQREHQQPWLLLLGDYLVVPCWTHDYVPTDWLSCSVSPSHTVHDLALLHTFLGRTELKKKRIARKQNKFPLWRRCDRRQFTVNPMREHSTLLLKFLRRFLFFTLVRLFVKKMERFTEGDVTIASLLACWIPGNVRVLFYILLCF